MRVLAVAVLLLAAAVIPAAVAGGTSSEDEPLRNGLLAAGNHLERELRVERERRATRRAEREQSRTAYRGQSAGEAVALLGRTFPSVMGRDPERAVQLRSGERVVDYLAERVARVALPNGTSAIVESTAPLRARNDKGELAPVDLELEDRGAAGFAPRNPVVPVTIPARLDGPVRLGDQGLSLRALDVRPIDGVRAGAGVVYPNASRDADVVVLPVAGGAQVHFGLRSEQSPEVAALDLDLEPGHRARLTGGGDIEVVEGGRQVAMILRPAAWDADGWYVPSSYRLENDRVEVLVPHRDRDVAYPLLVDPLTVIDSSVSSNVWQFASNAPAQWNASLAPDGLMLAPRPGSYVAGSYGQWRYQAPRSSFVYRVDFDALGYTALTKGFEADVLRLGIASGTGIWQGANDPRVITANDAAPAGSAHCTPSTPACTPNPLTASVGNFAVFQYAVGSPYSRETDANRGVFGRTSVWLADANDPTITDVTHTPTLPGGWVRARRGEVSVRAHDSGLGVWQIWLTGPKAAIASVGCAGGRSSPCPETWTNPSGSLVYDTDQHPEGVQTWAVHARDPQERTSTSASWQVKVDRTAPNSPTFAGTLYDKRNSLPPESHTLTVTAGDGGTTPNSGVQRLEYRIKRGAETVKSGGADTPCSSECKETSSATFSVSTAGLAGGDYLVEGEAIDGAGNRRTASFTAHIPDPPRNTSLPAVLGTAQEGQTLTASEGTWDRPVDRYAYRWLTCSQAGVCKYVADATGRQFAVRSSDVDGTIRVEVTAFVGVDSASAISPPTATVLPRPPVSTEPPKISGTARDGETLTASQGEWSGRVDSYEYTWLRCRDGACGVVAGATQATYQLSSADLGATMRVRVRARNTGGYADAESAPSDVIAATPPSNVELPRVSGTAATGQMLTATTGTWQGTPPISYAYQWRRCDMTGAVCGDIAGATQPTYQVQAADETDTLRVRVIARNAAGSATADSAPTAQVPGVPPKATRQPEVIGIARVGETVTADPGEWDHEITSYSYQWQLCYEDGTGCANALGRTDAEYKIESGDLGRRLRVLVTAHARTGSTVEPSALTEVVANPRPENVAPPTISGTLRDGETLKVSQGSWTWAPSSYAYQWLRCDDAASRCEPIGGADGPTYRLVSDDVGHRMLATVRAENDGGFNSADSARTGVVAGIAPSNAGAPSIEGSAVEDATVYARAGTWNGSTPIDHSYQWRRCDSGGASCQDIAGATAASYTIPAGQTGRTLRVRVTARNQTGAASAESPAHGPIEPAVPTNTAAPQISEASPSDGTLYDGETLTATAGTWRGSQPIEYTYRWQRCGTTDEGACADIEGLDPNQPTYTLTHKDVDAHIRVHVTASNGGGTGTATSAPTGTVRPLAVRNTAAPSLAGVAREGRYLSTDSGSWSGSPPFSFGYAWQRCEAASPSCESPMPDAASMPYYKLRRDDVARRVRVTVTADGRGGRAQADSTYSGIVEPVSPTEPPTIFQSPTITPPAGGFVENSEVTAMPGLWHGPEKIEPTNYEWLRCENESCTTRASGASSRFRPGPDEAGKFVRVRVTVKSGYGIASGPASSVDYGPIAFRPPRNVSPPTVPGTPREGVSVTATNGTWSGTNKFTYRYQWHRCDGGNCGAIAGATTQSYRPVVEDVGKMLRVTVTATNGGGSDTATSASSTLVAVRPPQAMQAPRIFGTPREGDVLTVDDGTWDTPGLRFTYTWQRCVGTTCTTLPANPDDPHSKREWNQFLILLAQDASDGLTNRSVRALVTATREGPVPGTASSATAASAVSNPIAIGVAGRPTNETPPLVSGELRDRRTVSVSDGTWSPTVSGYTYRWTRCDDVGQRCALVAGATASARTLAAADVGTRPRAVVTAGNVAGAGSATALAAGTVQAAPVVNLSAPTIAVPTPRPKGIASAGRGDWDGSEPISWHYQWRRCDSQGEACKDIARANAANYEIAPDDASHTLRVRVTASNPAGSAFADSARSVVIGSGYAEAVLEDQPWGFWRFDDDLTSATGSVARDSSGRGHDYRYFVPPAASEITFDAWRLGRYARIQGGSYIHDGNFPEWRNNTPGVHTPSGRNFTIEMWVRSRPNRAVGEAPSPDDPQIGGSTIAHFGPDEFPRDDTGTDDWGKNEDDPLKVSFRDGYLYTLAKRDWHGWQDFGPLTFDGRIDDQEWHHLAIVRNYDSGQLFLYVDGVRHWAAWSSIKRGDYSPTLAIGNAFGDLDADFDIDEPAVYERALAFPEILEHLQAAGARYGVALPGPENGGGLEKWFEYETIPTGAGGRAHVNLGNGNLVWHKRPIVNPGRGLSTVVDLTYNAQRPVVDDALAGYFQPGRGFSISASTLTRLNERLDLGPPAADPVLYPPVVRLTDADGTTHTFRHVGDGVYKDPPGANLRLRRVQYARLGPWAITDVDGLTHYFDEGGYPTSVADRNDNWLRYEYEPAAVPEGVPCGRIPEAPCQRVKAVRDATGRALTITYYPGTLALTTGEAGRIQEIADHQSPNRRRLRFNYTPQGNLSSLTEAYGTADARTTRFQYSDDALGPALVGIVDPAGQTTRIDSRSDDLANSLYSAELLGRRVEAITDRSGATTRFTYTRHLDANEPARTTVTNGRGHARDYVFDRHGRPQEVTDAHGVRTELRWDDWRTHRPRDHNLTWINVAAGTGDAAATTLKYHPTNGVLTEIVDPERRKTRLQYRDSHGIQPLHPADNDGTFVSDLASITTPRGFTEGPEARFTQTFDLDARGNVTAIRGPEDSLVEFDHDEHGQVLEERQRGDSAEDVNVTRFRDYDANGLPQRMIDPRGNHWVTCYDAVGNVITETDPRNDLRNVEVPPCGQLHGQPFTTTYRYDELDQVVRSESPWDSRNGQFITRTATYDPNGNVKTKRDGTGAEWAFHYTPMDQLREEHSPATPHHGEAAEASEVTRYAYDAAHNLIEVESPRGTATAEPHDYVTRFFYDPLDRGVEMRRVHGGREVTTRYEYDLRDNLRYVTDPRATLQGESGLPRWEYQYDKADNRIAEIEDPFREALRTAYKVDANDNVTEVTDPRGAGHTEKRVYDARDLLTTVVDPLGGQTYIERRADGEVRMEVSPRGVRPDGSLTGFYQTRYHYLPTGEVEVETIPEGPGEPFRGGYTYQRDAVGNPTRIVDPRNLAFENTFFDTGELRSTQRPSHWGGGAADSMDGSGGADPGLPGDFGAVERAEPPSFMPVAGFTRLEYDAEQRLTKVIDGHGEESRRDYDAVGRVRQTSQPFDGSQRIVSQFEYDRNGNVVRSIDPEGYATRRDFDGWDRVRKIVAPGSSAPADVTNIDYDDNGNVVRVETPRGEETPDPDDYVHRYRFNQLDRMIEWTDPLGGVTAYGYDRAGNRTSVRTPRGHGLTPDVPCELGGPTSFEQAACFTTKYDFDALDRVVKETDGFNHQTKYAYDADSNVIETDASGSRSTPDGDVQRRITRRVYDGRGILWKETTAAGTSEARTAITEHDANGNLRRVVNPAGVDGDGNPRIGDHGGAVVAGDTVTREATVYEYDADNLVTAVNLPSRASGAGADAAPQHWRQEFQRDGLGRVAWIDAPFNASVSAASCDESTQNTRNCRSRTSYEHFRNGWINKVTDPKIVDPDAGQSYDHSILYLYDRRGLQTKWRSVGASGVERRTVRRSYFPSGQLAKREGWEGAEEGAPDRKYTYLYNRNGSLVSMDDEDTGRAARRTSILRDALERERAVNERWGEPGAQDPDRGNDTVTEYDADGNPRLRLTDGELQTRDEPLKYRGGTATVFSHDPLGRETHATVYPEEGRNRTYRTTYWPSNQMRERTRSNGVSERFYYYADGRLARRDRTKEPYEVYKYDANGNRSRDERGLHVFNARGQLVEWTGTSGRRSGKTVSYKVDGSGSILEKLDALDDSRTTYQYRGNRLKRATTVVNGVRADTDLKYDHLGQVKEVHTHGGSGAAPIDETTTYSYDAFERLRKAKGPGDAKSTTYCYDGLDRRDRVAIKKSTGEGATGGDAIYDCESADPAYRVYDLNYVGTTEALSRERAPGVERFYDYDSGLNRLGTAFKDLASDATPRWRPYRNDANGSVEAVEDDDSTDVTGRYAYDPYGELLGDDGKPLQEEDEDLSDPARQNPFRFEGFYYEENLKTSDMQARDYRPGIGRFLTQDRYEGAVRDLELQADPLLNNRYAFAAGNPVDRVEWDGHGPEHGARYNRSPEGVYDAERGKMVSGPRAGQGPGGSGYRQPPSRFASRAGPPQPVKVGTHGPPRPPQPPPLPPRTPDLVFAPDAGRDGKRTIDPRYDENGRRLPDSAVNRDEEACRHGTRACDYTVQTGTQPEVLLKAIELYFNISPIGRAFQLGRLSRWTVMRAAVSKRRERRVRQLKEPGWATWVRATDEWERKSNERLKYWRASQYVKQKVYKRDDIIDLERVDHSGRGGLEPFRIGKTNRELMAEGKAPVGPDGREIGLHHVTQRLPGPVAELTYSFERKYRNEIHIWKGGKKWEHLQRRPHPKKSGAQSHWVRWQKKYWQRRLQELEERSPSG